jgi:hypothetical protein
MFNIELEDIDIEAAVRDLVPTYQQQAILSVLNEASFDEADSDRLGMELLGEGRGASFLVPIKNPSPVQGPSGQVPSLWENVKAEVYDLFCTKSSRYASERKDGNVTVKNLITIVATAVAAHFSLPIGIIVGAATLCVMTAIKVGLNAYCKTHAPAA